MLPHTAWALVQQKNGSAGVWKRGVLTSGRSAALWTFILSMVLLNTPAPGVTKAPYF